jgi:ribonuclease R
MEAFKEFIRGQGYDMDTNHGVNPKIFSDLLEKIKGSPAETVISKIMLRSMQKAKYSTDNNGHFGLSLEFYCHFTSPIRRYPDLMVHRMLKAYLTGQTEDGEFVSRYKRLAENAATQSSEREIAAEKSERDIDDYYKAVYMTGKIGEKYTGIVSGVLSSGIFAALDNTVEGFVPVTELPDDRYGLDEKNYRLIGTKYTFSIGDKVEVIIKSAVIETRSVGMGLISSPQNHLRKKDKGVKI